MKFSIEVLKIGKNRNRRCLLPSSSPSIALRAFQWTSVLPSLLWHNVVLHLRRPISISICLHTVKTCTTKRLLQNPWHHDRLIARPFQGILTADKIQSRAKSFVVTFQCQTRGFGRFLLRFPRSPLEAYMTVTSTESRRAARSGECQRTVPDILTRAHTSPSSDCSNCSDTQGRGPELLRNEAGPASDALSEP